MAVGRPVAAVELSAGERSKLEELARRRKTGLAMALRARIVLSCASGMTNGQVAAKLGVTQNALLRIWQAFGLKPHLQETFKLSTDPFFVAKVRDVVGLYVDPPEQTRALVLCVDEKSQVQALERIQPLLPMKPGQPERRTHDYVRHGTTSLFAALDIATGKVIGQCHSQHHHQEFLSFLRRIDREVPSGMDIHLIMDNYATTRRRRSRHGSRSGRAITCTSPRPLHPGSIRWNAGSRASPSSASTAAPSGRWHNWRRPSSTTLRRTTATRSP